MGHNPSLSKETLICIHTLYKAEYSIKDICEATNVSKWSMQRWIRRCGETKDGDVPTQLKKPGPLYKLSHKTLNIIRRELKTCPTLSACEIKEKNSQLLATMSIRTVSRYMKEARPSLARGHTQMCPLPWPPLYIFVCFGYLVRLWLSLEDGGNDSDE